MNKLTTSRTRYNARFEQPKPKPHHLAKFLFVVIAIVVIVGGYRQLAHMLRAAPAPASASTSSTSDSTEPSAAAKPNVCTSNSSGQLILVSISQQHLWACDGTSQSYNSAVITGMELYPADLTPTGTYHIYAKATDQTLAGHDSTGSWSDFVNYWMPFLDNQYGTYGFHDLTQADNGANGRADNDFGNININAPYTAAKHGSHGCVELPLATAKWLYDWAPVGTTVTIET